MTDARWEQRHAALICLAQIAEGCAKVMLQNKQVTGLVQMCKQARALKSFVNEFTTALHYSEYLGCLESVVQANDDNNTWHAMC